MNKEKIIKYIKTKFDEKFVDEMIDEQIPDYIDTDENGDHGFDDEFEAYAEQGRGEAEADVVAYIKRDVLNELGIGDERFEFEIGMTIDEMIIQIHPKLDT